MPRCRASLAGACSRLARALFQGVTFLVCGLCEGGEGDPFEKGSPSPPSSSLLSLPKTFILVIGPRDNTGNVRVSTAPGCLARGNFFPCSDAFLRAVR